MRTKEQKANYDKAVKRIRRFAQGGTFDAQSFRMWFCALVLSPTDITTPDYLILQAREELAYNYFRRNGGVYCPGLAT